VLPLPEAAGTPYALDGEGSPVSKHFISQVINGIEKQKQEDKAIERGDIQKVQQLAPGDRFK
jgi:hypothetical protein